MGPGDDVLGYRLERELGRGATSTVYLAQHLERGHQVALKVLASHLAGDARSRARCRREVRAAAVVRHPAIVKTRSLHISDAPPLVVIAMELVEGPSLLVLRGHPLAPVRAREAALQLTSGVAAAHAAGVVHRDLKPANLLFRFDPRVGANPIDLGIIDFGCARPTPGSRSGLDGPGKGLLTTAGATIGTPAYMAPEQIGGRGEVGTPADVYALGALVFELFTGERAFTPVGPEPVLQRKLRGHVPDLRLPEPIEGALGATLRACLEPEPSRRPSARDLHGALTGLRASSLSIPAGMTAVAAPMPLRHARNSVIQTVDLSAKTRRPARRGRRLVEQSLGTSVAESPAGDAQTEAIEVPDEEGASTLPLDIDS